MEEESNTLSSKDTKSSFRTERSTLRSIEFPLIKEGLDIGKLFGLCFVKWEFHWNLDWRSSDDYGRLQPLSGETNSIGVVGSENGTHFISKIQGDETPNPTGFSNSSHIIKIGLLLHLEL